MQLSKNTNNLQLGQTEAQGSGNATIKSGSDDITNDTNNINQQE